MLTIRNIRDETIKHYHPNDGIRHSFFELVEFPMFVADTLVVLSDSLNSDQTLSWRQKLCVELIVLYNTVSGLNHKLTGRAKDIPA